jgi:hypothetical protein
MSNQKKMSVFFACLLLIAFHFSTVQRSAAQLNQLVLENEQHWETYQVGGSCISGTGGNIFVRDIDNDGVTEIITGGYTYDIVNGTPADRKAPLNIWSWNGQNITLEKSQKWLGRISCLFAGDANGDGQIDIVTAASFANDTGNYLQLRIWKWDNISLTLETSHEWAYNTGSSINSLFVGDLEQDGTPEILTYGRLGSGGQFSSQISIWHWNGNNLNLTKSAEWGVAKINTARDSVYAYDLDNDGMKEIITGGYANDLENSSGQLRVWRWNGENFILKANQEWRLVDQGYSLTIAGGIQGNTVVNNVKAGDVDGDGAPEIVTGGFAYDGEKLDAQLRIWNWTGEVLNLEKSQEWTTQDIVEVKAISIDDVDGDGRREIVTSGGSGVLGSFASNITAPEMAQLRVWSWDGTSLALKQDVDWYIDSGALAQNVATGDLDKDGVKEIVTVGCTYFNTLCDPDMRIWSIAKDISPFPYALLATAGILVVISSSTAFLLLKKKRQ